MQQALYVRAGFVPLPEKYYFCSPAYYLLQDEQFGFFSHYRG
jgi:hypothetical protein